MLCFSFRLSAVDEITYLVACHYSLIALSSAVGLFCVLHYVANKLSHLFIKIAISRCSARTIL